MKASYSASESGSVASSFSSGSFEPQRRLHLAPRLLLAEDVGDVIGAEGARRMGLLHRSGDCLRAIVANQREQFADLPGEGAIRIRESSQIVFRGRTRASATSRCCAAERCAAAICANSSF